MLNILYEKLTTCRAAAMRRAFALSVLAALGGCQTFPLTPTEFGMSLESEPFVQQRASDAWVAVDGTQLVLERALGPVSEQRILLPNRTALSGENVMHLRARRGDLVNMGRFRPLDLLGPEGTPHPFDPFEDLSFRTEDDVLGTLSWAVWTNQAGLNCVLAFRRLDATTRVVPADAAIADMMLRNCIHGSVEEALEPARPSVSGFAATGLPARGAPEMLSPLAGPQP
ncbi:hypothetical protein [Salipiger mucosus]|uniref:Lipoprotein n=1 Tax=Salipiger mucosus DSM 16094 TaxID=1123237 RepID=S9QKP5_9RHOB|nr:hypothetical protein [Salipiger mucosus]EPX80367.1 hypothetical protein Salmuc_03683 [Salipiger mucosus DSM 16094]